LAKKKPGIEPGDRVLIEHHVSRVWDDGRITIEVAGAPVTIKATVPADHESIREVLKRATEKAGRGQERIASSALAKIFDDGTGRPKRR
jgi:hypothetical protein